MLRTHRLKWGLYQKDLAALVPHTGTDRVSRVERNKRSPNAREILAYGMIFGLLAEDVFPGLVSEVEETLIANAYLLHRELEGDSSPKATRRRVFLEAILARAADRARSSAQ